MRIALAGNPNSGKTTMYNALTGKHEKAGNWAGVTVERKNAPLKKNYSNGMEMIAVDLPGAYSMSPFTSEESITSSYVKQENPDAIINIVDATNLSRSLFFTTQLLELGIPVVVALNKSDINEKKGTVIDLDALSEALQCPVVATTATSDKGLEELCKKVSEVNGQEQVAPYAQGDIDLHSKAAVETADRKRFDFVNSVVAKVETRKVLTSEKTRQDKLDAVLAHKWVGIPIFAIIMYIVFDLSQATLGPLLADALVGWLEGIQEIIAEAVGGASPFLQALLVDGIVGGVIAVLGFLPLVMVMYFLIALLEDWGYMARAAVVMDRFFKKVGLSGKSIIPMVIGTGCAIPAVMACRTIRNERERRTTAMLTPFMPCGAKLPVIALFAGAFFSDASWVGTLMYFAGIAFIILGALLALKITGTSTKASSYFIMELPEYKIPSVKRAFISMLERAKAFIVKAGTIILVCNAVVQIMQTFTPALQEAAENSGDSILALVASPFAILFIPLGFGVWQLAAAAVTGFIAKENVVGTLAVCFSITNFIDTEELELVGGSSEVAMIMGLTKVAALAYLMFNLFTPPCFAAIGAMNSEMKSAKWLWGGVCLQFGTGYVIAYLVYQIGTIITTGAVGSGFVGGLIAVLVMVGIVVYLIKKADSKVDAYALNGKTGVKA